MTAQKITLSQCDTLQLASHVGSGTPQAVLEQGNTGFLAANGVFFGNLVYVAGYTHICGFIYSDVSSAANGLVIEQGMQASDFDTTTPAAATTNITTNTFSITGGAIASNQFTVQIVAPFARLIYTNGVSIQSDFRLSSIVRALRGF